MIIFGKRVECHEDDQEWLKETISKIPQRQLIPGVINKYNDVYISGQNKGFRGAGAARRNANSRLRVYVKRLLESQK